MSSNSTRTSLNPADYAHSPVHHAVIIKDHNALTRILTRLPKLSDPTRIKTEKDSLTQELIADQISAALDRRDVPYRETPLHLAVRLNDHFAVKSLAASGADISLQNSNGWNPLQESLCRKLNDIAVTLVRHHHVSAWSKWRRRLPRLISVLRRMRDFYMEISFHFESSVIPFVNKIAPSDTYKLWKRDGNLRADTTLAGFDGLKIQRADQSFLFLGDGDESLNVDCGSLLVLNRDDKKIFDAFENAGGEMSDADVAGFCAQTSVYRPGMDVTKAELVSRTNWRRQDKIENVGEWKAKVYELHNVLFSFRSRKVVNGVDANGNDLQQVLPLELDEDDDGFLVAENPRFSVSSSSSTNQRRHSSFVREEREFVSVGRKSVDIIPSRIGMPPKPRTERRGGGVVVLGQEPVTKEKEFVKSLRPCVWLTDQFPLKTEELLPLLDILANKVKAVRRLRELLTTKFPAGTFPVKVAIPVVPTVRVVITFTKFVELQPTEEFFTPLSSPRLLGNFNGTGGKGGSSDDEQKSETRHSWFSSSSSSSSSSSTWLRRSTSSRSGSTAKDFQRCASSSLPAVQELDPFTIPAGYSWSSIDDKSRSKVRKCKSTRKSK